MQERWSGTIEASVTLRKIDLVTLGLKWERKHHSA